MTPPLASLARVTIRDFMTRYLGYAFAALFAGYFAALVGLVAFQRDFLFRPDALRADPAAAGLAEAQETTLKTRDGEMLVAWRLPADCGRPFILYLHGNGGALRDRVPRFKRFVEDRFGMLAVSYRGYGGSTGAPAQEGLFLDAEAAYAEALRLGYAPERIVILGESLGTGVATHLAAAHHAAGLVLDSPYSSIADVAAERYAWAPVQYLVRDPFRSDREIGKARAPVLMVHGENDSVIPIRLARRLFDLANAPKTFLSAPGRDHLALLDSNVYPRVRDWIEAHAAGAACEKPDSN
ncbi:alpha/beta hydrolase [Methylocystis hirsuta]|uniref:alpha/beta hydrolase n=1 Tax=Methylocystis hirsuta TaxID=369798 RepID=UPI001FE1D6D8|nr:alpha/beta hydrolase [Methylocystis hirsuta]